MFALCFLRRGIYVGKVGNSGCTCSFERLMFSFTTYSVELDLLVILASWCCGNVRCSKSSCSFPITIRALQYVEFLFLNVCK